VFAAPGFRLVWPAALGEKIQVALAGTSTGMHFRMGLCSDWAMQGHG